MDKHHSIRNKKQANAREGREDARSWGYGGVATYTSLDPSSNKELLHRINEKTSQQPVGHASTGTVVGRSWAAPGRAMWHERECSHLNIFLTLL